MLRSSECSVSVGTTSGLFLGATSNRAGLVISAPKSNPVTISQRNPAVAESGLVLRPGTDATILDVDCVGPWLQGNLYAIAETAGETIGVIEILDI